VKRLVGTHQGESVYLDDELNKDAIALITHQQDVIEALRGENSIEAIMQRLIDKDKADG